MFRILNRDIVRVDFPAPVRPTMPIFSPACIFIDKLEIIKGRFGLYLRKTFSKVISPLKF